MTPTYPEWFSNLAMVASILLAAAWAGIRAYWYRGQQDWRWAVVVAAATLYILSGTVLALWITYRIPLP